MSQELNQPTSPQSNPQGSSSNPNPTPRKSNNSVMYWVIIAILLVACVYLFVSRRNVTVLNQQTTSQLATSDSSRKSIENDYNAALARLDELTTKNNQMDSMINDRNGEIAKLKSQINGILRDSHATSGQLAKARALIASLNNKTQAYEERIAQLEKDNTNLTNTNQAITQERDATVTQNIALKKVGSVLHASNIRLEALQLKRGGRREKETGKARKTDILRVTFDIDENRIAESGTKQLYLRITGPDGSLLSNAAYGSGVTGINDGTQLNYTMMKEVALQQNQPVKNIIVDWEQDNDYRKGDYNIEIYSEGYKVGSGSVHLR